jgi:CheY-like chemotaxis protein
MEGGHVTIETVPCDLAGVLHATIAGVRSLADEAGVRLRVNAPERPTVNGDPDKLVQVFTNLISNAIKFSPAGREVRVQLSTSDSTAIVSIADQGPGIPAEFRERIFGKFQQAAPSGARTTGGTGLGLAIARAIVELHGGTIRFETRHGAGTTFIVELPYAPAREVKLVRERPDRPYLLIIEPEAATRDALAVVCGAICEVVAVRSTEEALSAIGQAMFDTIIVDPDVSGHAGLDFVRALRESPGHGEVPVLLFAAREYPANELEPLGISPRDVVVKTVDRERTLVDRLLRAIKSRPQSLTTTFGRD